jgi:hypothetical protein
MPNLKQNTGYQNPKIPKNTKPSAKSGVQRTEMIMQLVFESSKRTS